MKDFFFENKRGIVGTIIFHVLIGILFILLGFSTPLPLPVEEGIMINFGTDATGFGSVEPERIEKVVPTPHESQLVSSDNAEEEIITQDIEDAASIETPKNETTQEKPKEEVAEQKEPEEEVREVNKNALFPGNQTQNNTSNGEGITEGDGNQGDIDGSIDSDNYSRGNGGKGVSFSLNGRSAKSLPKPEYRQQEQGKVVVEVTVDRYGNVKNATPGAKGTTTTDKVLWNAAKKAAMQTKFNINSNAPEFQRGTITYHFMLQ